VCVCVYECVCVCVDCVGNGRVPLHRPSVPITEVFTSPVSRQETDCGEHFGVEICKSSYWIRDLVDGRRAGDSTEIKRCKAPVHPQPRDQLHYLPCIAVSRWVQR
jgi:hypothetical protein